MGRTWNEIPFDEFQRRIYEMNPKLHILDEPKDNQHSPIRVKCDNCGGIYTTTKHNLRACLKRKKKEIGCPICAGRLVVKGINDVGTVASWLLPYFKNKEDAYTHTRTSKTKVDVMCPICKHERKMEIGKMYARGFSCPVCGDGISFPNKFGRAFLSQLPIENWVCEYHADWLGRRSFDNYFEYRGKKYVLEMDGGQHFNGWSESKRRTKDEEQQNDLLKDSLAKQNGIEVIRIDCRESDKYYIKNNLIKSELSEMFDLSNIDWEYCTEIACSNIMKNVCEYYNNHKSMFISEIAKKFHIDSANIRIYLKKGANYGLCDYCAGIGLKNMGERNKRIMRDKRSHRMKVYDKNMNFLGFFKSPHDCAEKLNEMYKDVHFIGNSINGAFYQNGKVKIFKHKGFTFEYLDKKTDIAV